MSTRKKSGHFSTPRSGEKNSLITLETIQPLIYRLPNRPPFMLDRDLAQVYGCETVRINKQAKRNPERFPIEFRFQLDEEELPLLLQNYPHLLSLDTDSFQNGSSVNTGLPGSSDSQSPSPPNSPPKSIDPKILRSWNRGYRPWCYTAYGANMLSTVLKSKVAAERSVLIMQAFTVIEVAYNNNKHHLDEESQKRVEDIQNGKAGRVLEELFGPKPDPNTISVNRDTYERLLHSHKTILEKIEHYEQNLGLVGEKSQDPADIFPDIPDKLIELAKEAKDNPYYAAILKKMGIEPDVRPGGAFLPLEPADRGPADGENNYVMPTPYTSLFHRPLKKIHTPKDTTGISIPEPQAQKSANLTDIKASLCKVSAQGYLKPFNFDGFPIKRVVYIGDQIYILRNDICKLIDFSPNRFYFIVERLKKQQGVKINGLHANIYSTTAGRSVFVNNFKLYSLEELKLICQGINNPVLNSLILIIDRIMASQPKTQVIKYDSLLLDMRDLAFSITSPRPGRIYNLDEVSAILRKPPSSIADMVKRGDFKGFQAKGDVFKISAGNLVRWIGEQLLSKISDLPPLITQTEAANLICISDCSIYNQCKKGNLQFKVLEGKRYIVTESLLNLFQ